MASRSTDHRAAIHGSASRAFLSNLVCVGGSDSANQNSTTRIHVQFYNRTSSLSVSLSALLNSYYSNEHSFSFGFGNRMYIWSFPTTYTRSRSVQLTRSRPDIMAEFDISLPFRDQTRVVIVQLQIQSAMPSYAHEREQERYRPPVLTPCTSRARDLPRQ